MATTVSNKVVRFGVVEFQAALKAASAKGDVKLDRARRYQHQDSADGPKVTAYEKVTRKDLGEVTGEVLTPDAVAYGIWEDGDFKPIPGETMDAIKSLGETEERDGSIHDLTALEIEDFVPLKDIDFSRSESAYFLVPQKGGIGGKPMRLLRDALKAEKVGGVFKFVVKGGGRQKLGVLHEKDGGLFVNVVAYAENFAQSRESGEALEQISKPEKAYVDMARKLIQAKTTSVERSLLTTARDSAVEAKAEALEKALDGKPVKGRKAEPAVGLAEADALLAKLRESVEQAKVAA
jgi:non-homologous end joining protein Ku